MPRDRARARNNDKSTSLLSSVFSFVSREIDSFVSSATGRPADEEEIVDEDDDEYDEDEEEEEEEEEQPRASSSRVQLPERKRKREGSVDGNNVSRRSRECASNKGDPSPSISRARSRSGRREDSDELTRRKAKRVASSPLTTPRPARRRPAPFNEDEEELAGPDRSPKPSHKFSPRRTHRRAASNFTMPGALYDRTSSLEPTPEPDGERTRHVRFASEVQSSPATPRNLTKTPRSSRHSSGPDAEASDSNQQIRTASTDDWSSEVEAVPLSSPIKRTPRPRRGSIVQEAVQQMSAEKNPNVSLLLPKSPVPTIYSSPTKGKEKEKAHPTEIINVEDSDEDVSSDEDAGRRDEADLSVRTRVKGKERELYTARQREREREGDDERRRDKERIRILEEELRKLREELAKRPAAPVASQTYSVPPPPPPPPPRPPITVRSQANQPSSTFADVRASLRHTGTPVEKPINPAAYGGPSVRKGQPTINLGGDLMAAFLSELKTHRLRKVGLHEEENSSASSAPRSQPAVRAREVGDIGNRSEFMIRPREIDNIGNRSEVLPRPNSSLADAAPDPSRPGAIPRHERTATARIGDKRKYVDASNDASQDNLPSKRRSVASSSHSVDTSTESITGHASSSTRSSRLPIPSGRIDETGSISVTESHFSRRISDTSAGSRISLGMRAETDITTPSLSSDNEHENGSNESREQQPPPTPPPEAEASYGLHAKGSESGARNKRGLIVHDADDEEDAEADSCKPIRQQDKARFRSNIVRSPEMAETFAKRAPASPRLLDSPRRPRPPARPRIVQEATQPDEFESTEHSLHASFTSAEPISLSQGEESRIEYEQEQQSASIQETPPRRFPIRPPKGMFKPPTKKAMPSRLPIRRGLQKNKISKPCARPTSNPAPSGSRKVQRRESLDAELARAEAEAEAAYEADILDEDVQLESGTLISRGSRNRKQGFIAFGGAGGPSAVMGEGSVEGIDNSESEEERQAMIPASRRRRSQMV